MNGIDGMGRESDGVHVERKIDLREMESEVAYTS